MARAFSPGGPQFPLGGAADLLTISSSQFNFRRRGRGGRRDLQVCKVSSPSRDPFCTLGLAPGASEQDIKRAYRRLALQYHPDVCQGDLCARKFMQIKDAYQLLMDGGVSTPYYYSEGFMGVNDDTWEDWEEWMGWEGAGTRDYTSHINYAL